MTSSELLGSELPIIQAPMAGAQASAIRLAFDCADAAIQR